MNEPKHTPGPWLRTITGPPGSPVIITGTGGRIGATTQAGEIARVQSIPEAWGDSEANARLIAAAPDLLEILTLAVRYLDSPEVRALPFARPAESVADQARAAIAKTEGTPRPSSA